MYEYEGKLPYEMTEEAYYDQLVGDIDTRTGWTQDLRWKDFEDKDVPLPPLPITE